MVKFLDRIFKFREKAVQTDAHRVVIHTESLGSSGTESYAGYAGEEYLQALRGTGRARIFDQMRRSDPQVKMVLKAVKDPIMSANWEVEPGDDSPEAKLDSDFINHVLFQDMDKPFPKVLSEALTMVDFGHAIFEVVNKAVLDHPVFGSYNGIKALSFRSQKTIERFNLDPDTGDLLSVSQYAYGDLQRLVDIPAQFLLHFAMDQEGSNYEGISAIRCCYGNWFRKNHYLKLNAIGIEKFAIPTPMVETPAGQPTDEQLDNMRAALEAYTNHESNYLIYPSGWKISLNNNVYDPEKVESSIDNEDKRMTKAFLANFLELGMNGVGSQALGNTTAKFFTGSLDQMARIISGEINQSLIPNLIRLNRGPRPVYPKLKHSGISDQAGEELSRILRDLREADFITPDDPLEVSLRKRIGLPPMSEEGKRAKQPRSGYPAPAQAALPAPAQLSLSERIKARRR